jgi:colanic acid biosynthesis protein WcaH
MVQEIPLNTYKKIHASMPIACVDIVIVHKGAILLGLRNNKPAQGTYWFPGGRILKGETLLEAAHRKTRQETGLNIKIIKQLGADETIFPDGPYEGSTHTINIVFLATCKDADALKSDSQNSDLKWFTKLPKNSPPYIKKFTKQALAEMT